MAEFQAVCGVGDLPEGAFQCFKVGQKEIVVLNVGGEIRAIDDECPHRGGPLSKGFLEGGTLYCPLHGWPFDTATGFMPGAPDICVPVYPTRVEGDQIMVSPEPVAPAQEA